MKNKITFEVRIDEELYRKLLVASEKEGRSLNNQMLHLIRTNIAYFERCHGKIDPAKLQPIIFDGVHHTYHVLGEQVGKAFSDGLKFK